MSLEEEIEREQERNDRLKREIADVMAEEDRLSMSDSPADNAMAFCLAFGPLDERVRQKLESDERLAALKRKKQGSTRGEASSTEAKSEPVSAHDRKAEHMGETSGQVMVTQPPSGKTRNARRAKKINLSRYLEEAHLTEKQYKCASLRWEYGQSVSQIARELKLHRKTVDQHIDSAQVKMRSFGLYEMVKKRLSQVRPGE